MASHWHVRWLIILLLILVVLFVWITVGRISVFSSWSHDSLYAERIYQLSGDAILTQTFWAKYPGLTRIDIHFRDQGVDDGMLVFRLKNSCASESDLQTIIVQENDIPSDDFYPFEFTPIDKSAGKVYCIVLEPWNLRDSNQLGVYASNVDLYPAGSAFYRPSTFRTKPLTAAKEVVSPTHYLWLPIVQRSPGKISREFDIGHQLHYNGPVFDTLVALSKQLSAHKPGLLGQAWFYGFIALLYIGGLIVLGVFVINLLADDGA